MKRKSNLLLVEPEVLRIPFPSSDTDDQSQTSATTAKGRKGDNASAANAAKPKSNVPYSCLVVRDLKKLYVDGVLIFDFRRVQMRSVSQVKKSVS